MTVEEATTDLEEEVVTDLEEVAVASWRRMREKNRTDTKLGL